MKVVILKGSPKGKTSVTLQYVKFIQKKYPQHDYVVHDVAHQIKKIENNVALYNAIIADVESADGILWAFPVYTFFVPAQYLRFIELIQERHSTKVFKNKYAAALSTSIHFHDNIAHNYMNAVCNDLEMNYTGFFSAHMDDLLKKNQRANLLNFARFFFNSMERKTQHQKKYLPVHQAIFEFFPKPKNETIDSRGKKILVLTDRYDWNSNLGKMINEFTFLFNNDAESVSLDGIQINGGCMGCMKCGYELKCAHNDQFLSFFNTKIIPADILIFAIEIKNRIFSSKWKEFFDRRYFNNHIPELKGKQIGFLISGSLSQMPYLSDFFNGLAEFQQANLAGMVVDECHDSDQIETYLHQLAGNTIEFSIGNYFTPPTFLGTGSHKVFRDEIFGKIRFICQADHRYYIKNNLYDFPHKNYKNRMFNVLMTFLTKIPKFRKELYKRAEVEMCKPYQKVVERV